MEMNMPLHLGSKLVGWRRAFKADREATVEPQRLQVRLADGNSAPAQRIRMLLEVVSIKKHV